MIDKRYKQLNQIEIELDIEIELYNFLEIQTDWTTNIQNIEIEYFDIMREKKDRMILKTNTVYVLTEVLHQVWKKLIINDNTGGNIIITGV